jgi:hypothetical protein
MKVDCLACAMSEEQCSGMRAGYNVTCCDECRHRVVADVPEQPFEQASFDQGMQGSRAAGDKWSDEERLRIDEAIVQAARELPEFTADEIWARAPNVRVTKGLAGRLNAAKNRKIIMSTGRVAFAQRGGAHDHRQRLAVWRSLIYRENVEFSR